MSMQGQQPIGGGYFTEYPGNISSLSQLLSTPDSPTPPYIVQHYTAYFPATQPVFLLRVLIQSSPWLPGANIQQQAAARRSVALREDHSLVTGFRPPPGSALSDEDSLPYLYL